MQTEASATPRPRRARGCLFWLALGLGTLVLAALILWPIANRESVPARPFDGQALAPPIWDAAFVPRAIEGQALTYPGLAPDGNATIHADAAQSDVHDRMGPIGANLEVRSRKSGNWLPRQCSTFTFRSDGRVVAMCGGLTGFRMVLIDPDTLAMLAYYDLPMRPSAFQAMVGRDMDIMFSDSSGGAYFFLDDRDGVVFADSRYQVQRIVAVEDKGEWQFKLDRGWDLRAHVPHDCQHYDNWFPSGECDLLTTVMPGPDGRYWWTTRYGRVGTLDPATGKIAQMRFTGEEIQNAIAMDRSAVYVLTDHRQYAMQAGADGIPRVLWSHAYDRGSARKTGSINQGSGTTPTLIGDRWIAFADNADGRINAVILRRDALADEKTREVCKVPVFDEGASATENSMIGWGRSIIFENNAGYTNALSMTDWDKVRGGMVRIDVRADESGCDIIWTSPLKIPSVVPKLAAKSGIVWVTSFAMAPDGKDQDWFLVGLDFATGKEVARVPTGRGKQWNNNWAAVAIGPDDSLWQGALGGVVQVRQRSAAKDRPGS